MFHRVLLFLCALVPVCAQTSSLSGTIQDPQGAVVGGAQVTVSSKTATTGSDGRYSVSGLTNGPATLTVEATGFKKVAKPVQITGATTENVTLELETLTESVLVTAGRGTPITGRGGDLRHRLHRGRFPTPAAEQGR
jgi:iron complex outermembrane receptor protein